MTGSDGSIWVLDDPACKAGRTIQRRQKKLQSSGPDLCFALLTTHIWFSRCKLVKHNKHIKHIIILFSRI